MFTRDELNLAQDRYKLGFVSAERQLKSIEIYLAMDKLTLSFALVNITILGLTNPDVNLKRMHHLYNVASFLQMEINLADFY